MSLAPSIRRKSRAGKGLRLPDTSMMGKRLDSVPSRGIPRKCGIVGHAWPPLNYCPPCPTFVTPHQKKTPGGLNSPGGNRVRLSGGSIVHGFDNLPGGVLRYFVRLLGFHPPPATLHHAAVSERYRFPVPFLHPVAVNVVSPFPG